MITLNRKQVEKVLNLTLPQNFSVLGVDTASRTGYSKIEIKGNKINIDSGFIHIDSKDTYFKFNQMIPMFFDLTKNCHCVIVEDVFMKFNVKVHSFLARIGMIVYMSAFMNNCKNIEFVWASSARKSLGLHGNAKKQIVQKEFVEKLKINIEDEDIIDAVILAFYGLIKHKEVLL